MSVLLTIGEHETDLYRFVSIDLPKTQLEAFTKCEPGESYPLRDALGITELDPNHVQILDLAELKTLGLETYLSDGLGIAETDYATVLPKLEALEGYLAVIASAAFRRPDILVPKPPVSVIAVLREDKPHKPLIDLSTASAEGTVQPREAVLDQTPPAMPFWMKVFAAVLTVALLYGLYALLTSGDTP